MGFAGAYPWIVGSGSICCYFGMNTNPATAIAYIANDGTYYRLSDENKKQNI